MYSLVLEDKWLDGKPRREYFVSMIGFPRPIDMRVTSSLPARIFPDYESADKKKTEIELFFKCKVTIEPLWFGGI